MTRTERTFENAATIVERKTREGRRLQAIEAGQMWKRVVFALRNWTHATRPARPGAKRRA